MTFIIGLNGALVKLFNDVVIGGRHTFSSLRTNGELRFGRSAPWKWLAWCYALVAATGTWVAPPLADRGSPDSCWRACSSDRASSPKPATYLRPTTASNLSRFNGCKLKGGAFTLISQMIHDGFVRKLSINWVEYERPSSMYKNKTNREVYE